mgnify:CR=1 FL=1
MIGAGLMPLDRDNVTGRVVRVLHDIRGGEHSAGDHQARHEDKAALEDAHAVTENCVAQRR